MNDSKTPFGTYQHYKTGKLYEVLSLARHSESYEELIIYKALYDCPDFGPNQIWARPKSLFLEELIHEGERVPRFKRIT
jgi:hypothetical protein